MLQLKHPKLWQTQCFIGGRWLAAQSGETIDVDNPATGKVLATVPSMNSAEVESAIAEADKAFGDWRQQSAQNRSAVLYRWHQLMLDNEGDLAALMTAEQGKPLKEALGEVRYAASYLKWFAEEAVRIYGDVIPAAKAGQKIIVQKQPVGVCAFITPWNFPVAMLARKAAAAIAAGCTVVAKPASATPFSALAFAYLAQEAGLPNGVLNVVTGQASSIGEVFTGSKRVAKVSFTGSTEVGQKLMAQSAGQLHKLSLELGGNAPCIVFDDADLDRAVEGIMQAKFRNAGQTCICINRLYVQQSVYSEVVQKLKQRVSALTVADGTQAGADIGPLINQEAVEKFQQHLQDALARGAKLVTGSAEAKGNFVQPVLLENANQEMLFCHEESFAPLLGVVPFATEEQAVALANDTPFGLAAYFYSANLQRVMRVMDGIEAGMVGVNETALSNPAAPFGGVKKSGFGREGSKYGLDDYVNIKYVLMG